MTAISLRRSVILLGAAGLTASLVLTGTVAAHAADMPYDETTDNSAFPYHLNPANEINGGHYTVTWTPTSRTDDGAVSGSPAGKWGPNIIKTDTGCPDGYRMSSRSFVVTPDGVETGAALMRDGGSVGWGLTGGPMTMNNTRAASWGTLTPQTNPDGVNAFVITCDGVTNGGAPGTNMPIANSMYMVTFFKMDWGTNHWEVTTDPRTTTPPVDKTATTTTVATSAVTATSATVTATIAPADATGTVQFTRNGTNIGSPVAVNSGQATTSVSGLTPATAYTFGAVYSGDTTHDGSTGTAASVTTGAAADSAQSSVSVSVPAETATAPTGLTIAVKPVALTTLTGSYVRNKGEQWQATGSLTTVTVNDDRQKADTPWSLSGSASDFVSGADKVAATNFGWTPAKSSGAGTAGDAVAPGANGGLSTAKVLAQGTGTADANVTTSVTAGLTLNVPGGTPAGTYGSILLLTLI